MDLLRKPAVQEWLARGAPAAAAPSAASQDTVGGEIKQEETNLAREFRRWVAAIRDHVAGVRDGAAQLPQELGVIGQNLTAEIKAKGFWQILIFAIGLLLLGYGCQCRLFSRLAPVGLGYSSRRHLIPSPVYSAVPTAAPAARLLASTPRDS